MNLENYHIISTAKYKEIAMELRFLSPVEKRRNAVRTLIAFMMSDRTKRYNSKQKMSEALDLLYGATYYAGSLSFGQMHMIRIRMKALHPDFSEPDQLLHQLDFLKQALQAPYFSEESLQEAKKVLTDNLLRQDENPSYYASKRIYEVFGEGTPLAVTSTGTPEIISSVSLKECIEEHQRMLKEDVAFVMVIGDVNEDRMKQQLSEYFPLMEHNLEFPISYRFKDTEVKHVEEVRNVPQSNVRLIYPNDTLLLDEDYWPMKLGCILLGQLPTSLLFQEIREKRSLCYSITSHNSKYFSFLQISTAVKTENIPEVLRLIEEQLRKVKEGEFAEELLDMAKVMLINDFEENQDDINGTTNQEFENYLNHTDKAEDLKRIESVRKEEVVAAFCKLQQPTVYILKGGRTDGEENE